MTFAMPSNSREIHTATFGRPRYLRAPGKAFNGPLGTIDPRGGYPSDPPGTIVLSPSAHGNGFANTGGLADPTTPLPASATITFSTPGVYRFVCLIHPAMRGTVVVKRNAFSQAQASDRLSSHDRFGDLSRGACASGSPSRLGRSVGRRGVRAHRAAPATIPGVPCDWLLVDGSSLIFRAFYGAQRRVKDAEALRTAAIGGFLLRLARLVIERRPARIAVADDADWRPQWRVEQLASYKEHRTAEPVPPGLVPQIPVIDAVVRAIGIDVIGVPGYEAEDVIASLAAQICGTIEIASGDRDLFALVEDPRVRVLYPEKSGLTVIDEAQITRRYAIPGRRYADFAILRGDPSDGLPGLRGIGAVSAAAMIRRHGDIAGVLRERDLRPADREYLERAVRIVPPVADLPIQLSVGRRESYPADPAVLDALTERYGLRESADRLLAALRTSSENASRSA